MVSVQKKSEAPKVVSLPPPQRAAVAANLSNDEKALLKAEKSASLHKGMLYGGAVGMIIGGLFALAVTTALFDPIGKVWSQRFIGEKVFEETVAP